jgi:RecA-family ATPase
MSKAEAIATRNVAALTLALRNELAQHQDNIPDVLKALKGWLVWQVSQIDPATGKFDKVPHYPSGNKRTGEQGSESDLANLGTFDEAIAALDSYKGFSGIGIAMLPQFGLVALDVDRCITDGVIRQDAADVTNMTYCEISPSGTGIRAFWTGKTRNGDGDDGWELYQEKQFLTVTGNQVDNAKSLVGNTLSELDAVTRAELERKTPNTSRSGKASKSQRLKDSADNDPILQAITKAGLYERDMGGGKHSIKCPRESEHSETRRRGGDGDTAYFQPHTNGYERGWIKCLHSHGDDQALYWKEIGYDDLANEFDPLPDEPVAPGELIVLTPITRGEMSSARITPRVVLPHLLYADVRMRISAGGTGKTTLALHEAITLALGRPLWGRHASCPCKTVIVTREDNREVLVARMREIMMAMRLEENDFRMVLNNMVILDMSGRSFRLSAIAGDVVTPHMKNLNNLIDGIKEWKPDWVIFDPLVSFGVGESRVNDAEQGLIEAFRILRNQLDACIEGIHHSGKANAREKTLDQYAGRGGSSLADGSRMVAVMQPLTIQEWQSETHSVLEPGESGIIMALPKLSYAPPQDPIFIRRRGYHFSMVEVTRHTPEQAAQNKIDHLYDFLSQEYALGRKYSKTDLDNMTEKIGLSRSDIRSALTELKVSGRVIYYEFKGVSGSHYAPLTLAADNGDTE